MITADKKETDINGYEKRFDVPLTKVGVFPYLGRSILPELEPDRIYYVLRPKEELTKQETLESLKNIPFIDEHTMIGEGFTPPEQKGIHGVTGENVKVNGDLITNDLIVYSQKLKELIDSGKRGLSMGYRCRYELTAGEYQGEHYDAIQRDILFNHVALVNEGRMGSECRVMDSKFTYDSLDIERQKGKKEMGKSKKISITLDEDLREEIKEEIKEELKDEVLNGGELVEEEKIEEKVEDEDPENKEMEAGILEGDEDPDKTACDEDKRKLIDEIGGILNGKVDEEILRTVMKKAEELAYNPSETGAGDACEEDEDEDPKKPEEEKEEKGLSMDEAIKYLAKRDEIVSRVKPLIGNNINYNKMTVEQVVKYACDKLDIKPSLRGLEGYLKGVERQKRVVSTIAQDSKYMPAQKSDVIREYTK